MASCDDLITNEDLATYKKDAEYLGLTVESPNHSELTPDGQLKRTISGMNADVDDAVRNAGGIDIGDYSSDPLITKAYEYAVFDRSGTPSNWKVKAGVSLPYQIDSTTYPTPQQDPSLQAYETVSNVVVVDSLAALTSADATVGKIVITNGRDSANDGKGAVYSIENGTAIPFKDKDLGGGVIAKWRSGIGALTGRLEDAEFKAEDKYFGGQTGIAEGGGVLILGDSITQGYGAGDAAEESYRDGYAFKLIQSIYNSVDQGQAEDRGYRYGSILSLASELEDPGVSTDGTLQTAGGAVDSFISLAAGQSITITGREVTFSDVYYTAGVGSLEFYLNGTLFDTKALTTGSGNTAVFTTFPTQINPDASYIKDTDVIKIQAAAGSSVNITGLLTLRTSGANYSPHVVVAAKSGWALDDFNQDGRADNICRHMNAIRGAGKKILVIVALGTNDIYNPSHANDPAGYIAELSNLIEDYKLYLTGDAEFLIQVPLEAVAPTGTVTGDPYLEYVSAIVEFCQTNGHQLYRADKTAVSANAAYNFDTIHPNKVGATILAKELTRTIGIPYNPYVHKTVEDGSGASTAVVEANNQIEEDAAFAAGALAVIRLDLLGAEASLFMDFETSLLKDDSVYDKAIVDNGATRVQTNPAMGAYEVNTETGYLTAPHDSTLNISTGAWGIEFYHRQAVNTRHNMFMSKGSTTVLANGWYFGLLNSGGTSQSITFSGINNAGMISIPYTHALDLTNNHHFSLNCDGSTVFLYLDGTLITSVAKTAIFENGDDLRIGDWGFSSGTAQGGYMDNIVFSNAGMLRNGNFVPPTTA